MPRIDGERLLADLRRMAEFGRYRTGVHRPFATPKDIESRHWLADRLRDAGLEPTIDGIGNVVGRSAARGPCLLLGSHTDTQPQGGWLDGVMGVMFGLEVARAFAADPGCADLGVDVASWADEEALYHAFLGSKSYVGELAEDEIDAIRHRDDATPLRDALAAAGLRGRPRLQAPERRHLGYLEAHIEQGGVLEHERKRIGVVTGIVGIVLYRIVAEGRQNHAGTTPMSHRRDAGVALMRLATAIHDRFPAVAGPRSVWTIGKFQLEPGAPAVIPGRAEMLLQFRDVEWSTLERMDAALTGTIEAFRRTSPCAISAERLSATRPTAMDEGFQAAIAAAAGRHVGDRWMRMPSGAGHDAQILAHRMPAGMMFVPSIGGVSHHISEATDEADIVVGCQVFADACHDVLRRASGERSGDRAQPR